MFARLILSVWAGSGQFIAPSGPESREHRGQVSLSPSLSAGRALVTRLWSCPVSPRQSRTGPGVRPGAELSLTILGINSGNTELDLLGEYLINVCENYCFFYLLIV